MASRWCGVDARRLAAEKRNRVCLRHSHHNNLLRPGKQDTRAFGAKPGGNPPAGLSVVCKSIECPIPAPAKPNKGAVSSSMP
ncbi:hypothetical protein TcasGA2_TC002704 [Tribolium castaneum]|uniref:Uncharacterized protein n=1 Tax=Tribolium castaneum TaxID=7070 RepID=D6WDV5_TRICA|nr:hypothetical protein TcasGA2_TC002704 [Tribolium castaneum]